VGVGKKLVSLGEARWGKKARAQNNKIWRGKAERVQMQPTCGRNRKKREKVLGKEEIRTTQSKGNCSDPPQNPRIEGGRHDKVKKGRKLRMGPLRQMEGEGKGANSWRMDKG